MLKSMVREALLTSVACDPCRCVSCQTQPAVHRAEGQLAVARPAPRARHVVEDPLELGAGEIGVDDAGRCFAAPARPGRARAGRAQPGSVRRSCQTMALCTRLRRCGGSRPRVVSRWLVMPMARDVAGRAVRPWPAPRAPWPAACPDLQRVVLHPARLRVNLRGTRAGPWPRHAAVRVGTRCCASWRCPGPGRAGRSSRCSKSRVLVARARWPAW